MCCETGDVFAEWLEQEDEVDHLRLARSGDLTFEGEVPGIVADVDGSGDMRLGGSTEYAELTVHGSGDLDAYALSASEADIIVDLSVTIDGPVERASMAQAMSSCQVTSSASCFRRLGAVAFTCTKTKRAVRCCARPVVF